MKSKPLTHPNGAWRLQWLWVTLLILGLSGTGRSQPEHPEVQRKEVDLPKAFERLKAEWGAGHVVSVEIIHVSTERHYPVTVTPSRLDRWRNYKAVFSEPKDQKVTQQLMRTVE